MVKKCLPFSFFDDNCTKEFFKKLNSRYVPPGRKKMKTLVLERFKKAQGNVKECLSKITSKLSFTIDSWTAVNGRSYYGITCHFLDEKWQLQSFVLDFIPAFGQHSGQKIAELFYRCICEYGIKNKIMGITMDNAAANTTFMYELSLLLPHIDSKNQHFRCISHILNLGVQDLLKSLNIDCNFEEDSTTTCDVDDDDELERDIDEVDKEQFEYTSAIEYDGDSFISKIRSLSKKIRRQSENLRLRFKSACDMAGVTSNVCPILDVPTRWNSTQAMLKTAIKQEKGLELLCENEPKLSSYKLTEHEWILVKGVQRILKMFKKVSDLLCGEKYATLPVVIVTLNLIVDKIEEETKRLNDKVDRSLTDEALIRAYEKARDKILKHYQKTNWLYCACLVLDPRHKEETFDLTKWGKELKNMSMETIKTMYETYRLEEANTPSSQTSPDTEQEDDDIDPNYLYSKKNYAKADLEKYLQCSRCDSNTDILTWWKLHQQEYPTLSKIARDVLAIQATSVPAERLFSKAALVLRKHRNRLSDVSVRSLLCLNSWTQCKYFNL